MRKLIEVLGVCFFVATGTAAGAQQSAAPAQQNPASLTLADAERIAIQNNPTISVARLVALAQGQVVRETRSSWMPTVTGNLTAVDAHQNTRITAGVLNNPSIYDRAAGGLTVSQLITDFGRTHNLVLSAKSRAQAQLENQRATEQDIRLAVIRGGVRRPEPNELRLSPRARITRAERSNRSRN